MGGLAKICKLYGRLNITENGKKVMWVYDYALDKPRLKSEMTKEELKASEKAKWNNYAKNTKKKDSGF